MSVRAPSRRPPWQDAYDVQMALWRWYRTDVGRAFIRTQFQRESEGMSQNTREMETDLWSQEFDRLLDCDPIHVSAEMCDVVEVAKEQFRPEPLLETDLITPRGFLLYERPFVIPDRFEEPTYLRALSWTRTWAVDDPAVATEYRRQYAEGRTALEAPDGEVHIGDLEAELSADDRVTASGLAVTLYANPRPESPLTDPGWPPVVPIHITPWYFGMSFDGNEWDELGVPTGAEWWWRLNQTTFRLMQQRLAHKTLRRPDRSARREAKRLRYPDDREVIVVQLRREAGPQPATESEQDVEWTHRWIVSGHWRNQWYPTDKIHRQIWISPYVKGPEDKPLIVRPRRVFQWDR